MLILAPDSPLAVGLGARRLLHPRADQIQLGRMQSLLAQLGHPERRLPPVFHVAGTNGKGSCCAFLRALLEAAGYRVHVTTSPHLVRINERIRLAGELISDAELTRQARRIAALIPDAGVSFFELITAIALDCFAHIPADAVVLETGLGGRLDATNVVSQPAATGITHLSYDHQDFLGPSIDAIASHKAGIMRHKTPCIIGPQSIPSAMTALLAQAEQQQALPYAHGRDWRLAADATGFTYHGARWTWRLPAPALTGRHQYDNAATALAMLEQAPQFQITAAAAVTAMQRVVWPARLQQLTDHPLCRLLAAGSSVWLDGGHNDTAGDALAAQAAEWQRQDPRPLWLVWGMLQRKDAARFLRPLAPWLAGIRTVPIAGQETALSPASLAALAAAAGVPAQPASSVREAIQQLPTQPVRVLIAGSLYLAGLVLAEQP